VLVTAVLWIGCMHADFSWSGWCGRTVPRKAFHGLSVVFVVALCDSPSHLQHMKEGLLSMVRNADAQGDSR